MPTFRGPSKAPPPNTPLRPSGLSFSPVQSGTKPKAPDWNYWRQIPKTELWKAVSLSCNAEPRSGSIAEFWNDRQRWQSDHHGPPHQQFLDRIDIALAHLSTSGGLRPARIIMGDPLHTEIVMQQFAAWCINMKWTIPEELAALASEAETRSGYLEFDPKADTYPQELDIACQAWRYATNNRGKGKSPKQLANEFLSKHYKNLSSDARERIATVCNWDKKGGAPGKK